MRVCLAGRGQMVRCLSEKANLQRRRLGNKPQNASRGYLNTEEEVGYEAANGGFPTEEAPSVVNKAASLPCTRSETLHASLL